MLVEVGGVEVEAVDLPDGVHRVGRQVRRRRAKASALPFGTMKNFCSTRSLSRGAFDARLVTLT